MYSEIIPRKLTPNCILSTTAEVGTFEYEAIPNSISSDHSSIAPQPEADTFAKNSKAALQPLETRGLTKEKSAWDSPSKEGGAKQWAASGTFQAKDPVFPYTIGDSG